MKKILLSAVLAIIFAFTASAQPGNFGVKAIHVDFRTQVMTMDAMKELADRASSQGFNTIIMEWEATFPFHQHATLCNQYSFTAGEVEEFVSYCGRLGLDVIPLQNCFGHCEYILRHDRYAYMRENGKDISQVCPLKTDRAIPVFTEIFAEVAALHPSKYFHIGADETFLLGSCKRCSGVAAEEGKSRLFVDYVNAMSSIITDMGKIPVIWADIILKYPESLPELSKDLVFVDWNYGWDVNRFGDLGNLHELGVEMWGATAMRSGPDDVYLVKWKKHFDNLTTFVPFCREKGCGGMVQTSWSTSGAYGFHYETYNEVVNIQPIRQVYPMSAFNILIAASAEAYNSPEPLDAEAFVADYAQRTYGFSPEQADVLWKYFCMPQNSVRGRTGKDDTGVPIEELLDGCREMKVKLAGLSPKKNKKEFAHYVLMLDLRINYLEYKQVDYLYQSNGFDRTQAAKLAGMLRPVVRDADKLSSRFIKLNKWYLKDVEFVADFKYKEKMNWLYDILTAHTE